MNTIYKNKRGIIKVRKSEWEILTFFFKVLLMHIFHNILCHLWDKKDVHLTCHICQNLSFKEEMIIVQHSKQKSTAMDTCKVKGKTQVGNKKESNLPLVQIF